jgi:hypothetical protein
LLPLLCALGSYLQESKKAELIGAHQFFLYLSLNFETPLPFFQSLMFSGSGLQRIPTVPIDAKEELQLKLTCMKVSSMHIETYVSNLRRKHRKAGLEESEFTMAIHAVAQVLPILFMFMAGEEFSNKGVEIIPVIKSEVFQILEPHIRKLSKNNGLSYEKIKDPLHQILAETEAQRDRTAARSARARTASKATARAKTRSSLRAGRSSLSKSSLTPHRSSPLRTFCSSLEEREVENLKAAVFGDKVHRAFEAMLPSELSLFADLAADMVAQALAMAFNGSAVVSKAAVAQAKVIHDDHDRHASCLGPELKQIVIRAAAMITRHGSDSTEFSFECEVPSQCVQQGTLMQITIPEGLPSAGTTIEVDLPSSLPPGKVFAVVDPMVPVTPGKQIDPHIYTHSPNLFLSLLCT